MSFPTLAPKDKPHPAHHVFSKIGLAVLVCVIAGSFLATALYTRTLLQSGQLAAVISATLVDLANEDRTQQELGALSVNPILTAAAKAKAEDMALKGYFAHNSPEGLTPWHWISSAGYSFLYAGENLAVNFSDSEDVERAWMESPTHRANILNGNFTEVGIATAVGEYEGRQAVFVVQMFGTPREVSAAASRVEMSVPENPEEIAVATASEGAPEVAAAQASVIERVVASPHTLLRTLYVLCALFIIGALALVTRMEFARHHFRHVIAASALLVLLSGLFYAADILIFAEPTLTEIALTREV